MRQSNKAKNKINKSKRKTKVGVASKRGTRAPDQCTMSISLSKEVKHKVHKLAKADWTSASKWVNKILAAKLTEIEAQTSSRRQDAAVEVSHD